jgi:hypothetical protein
VVIRRRVLHQGHTISLGTETFLVGYRFAAREIDPNQRRYDARRFPPLPTGLSPETKLELSLLNTRLVSALNNVRPFAAAGMAASNERVAAAQKMRTEAVNAASLQNLQTLARISTSTPLRRQDAAAQRPGRD